MNEISILMHLLSNKKDLYQIGATKKQILKALNLTIKNKTVYFQMLITELSRIIEPLGLQIRFNPLDSHWFIIFEPEISDHVKSNPFGNKPSLAATLFSIIACCLKNSGYTTVQEIQKLRKKKTILDDIRELEKKGYVNYNKNRDHISLTPLIGYQLDMEKLFIKLSLKLKEVEEN
ncbi:MAG: hypothetical protein ACFFAK_17685 [Promethearchaeota archaeon]